VTKHHDLAEIYNESTCFEFHVLLCDVLSKFKGSLDELFNKKTQEPPVPDILQALSNVLIFGDHLSAIVKSSVAETHLQTIAGLLFVDTRRVWTHEFEDDADFADFQRLKPYSMRKGKLLLPWESYRDWLMLMVHYFDAADTLVAHALELQHPAISIAILSPPIPNKTILTWTKLLESQRYFPDLAGESSGKDFVQFLNCRPVVDVNIVDEAISSAQKLKEKLESNLPTPMDSLASDIAQLDAELRLVNCEDAVGILEEIVALTPMEPSRRPAQMQTVIEMLHILKEHAHFYSLLRGAGALNSGQLFKALGGTYHCEAYIAALLALWGRPGLFSDFKKMQTKSSVQEISQIEALLVKIKVSHAFMLRLNLC
jgi:hypothetical protein